jgi:hypothetical protein
MGKMILQDAARTNEFCETLNLNKKLWRIPQQGMVRGVCAGLAAKWQYHKNNPTLYKARGAQKGHYPKDFALWQGSKRMSPWELT